MYIYTLMYIYIYVYVYTYNVMCFGNECLSHTAVALHLRASVNIDIVGSGGVR